MTKFNPTRAKTVNALIWAAMMIATPLVFIDAAESSKTVILMLQIGGWLAIDNALTTKGRSFREEWACIKSKFNSRK